MKFELFRRRGLFGWKWYFRLRAANGEIVAQSEAYSRKMDATVTMELIRRNAADAQTFEVP